jgi:REP element-mobilizing transposase RayT
MRHGPNNPYFRPEETPAAYQLRFNWVCWPRTGTTVPELPPTSVDTLEAQWHTDGIRPLEYTWRDDEFSVLFSTKPDVSPMTLASRAKGRLQYHLRKCYEPVEFQRNFCIRAVGDSNKAGIGRYLENQVDEEDLASDGFAESIRQFTFEDEDVDLSEPRRTNSGRYFYALHLVFVWKKRWRMSHQSDYRTVASACRAVAAKHDYWLWRYSVVPDHLHVALGAPPEQSPQQVALSFMNNLTFVSQSRGLLQSSFYAGTFGEYGMAGIRAHLSDS